jgi:hypothetical protein
MTKRESTFQATFIKLLRERHPGAIILKLDPNYLQGIPDLLMLIHDTWAAFEVKRYKDARQQPNQEAYVNLMDGMSFAAFVYPENAQDVLDELQRALSSRGPARVSRRQQLSLDKLRSRQAS